MPFVPLLATIRVEWTTSDSTHGTCECLNLFEKQNKIAGGTYNPKDICETLSTEFISFREPGVQKQGQKSLFPCQERWNEETPHPGRSAIPGGRKEDGRGGRPGEHTEEEIDGAGRLSSLPPPGEEAERKPSGTLRARVIRPPPQP